MNNKKLITGINEMTTRYKNSIREERFDDAIALNQIIYDRTFELFLNTKTCRESMDEMGTVFRINLASKLYALSEEAQALKWYIQELNNQEEK